MKTIELCRQGFQPSQQLELVRGCPRCQLYVDGARYRYAAANRGVLYLPTGLVVFLLVVLWFGAMPGQTRTWGLRLPVIATCIIVPIAVVIFAVREWQLRRAATSVRRHLREVLATPAAAGFAGIAHDHLLDGTDSVCNGCLLTLAGEPTPPYPAGHVDANYAERLRRWDHRAR